MKENKIVGFYIGPSGNRMDKALRMSQVTAKVSVIK